MFLASVGFFLKYLEAKSGYLKRLENEKPNCLNYCETPQNKCVFCFEASQNRSNLESHNLPNSSTPAKNLRLFLGYFHHRATLIFLHFLKIKLLADGDL